MDVRVISSAIDSIADRLEAEGLYKEAHELDTVSNSLEAVAASVATPGSYVVHDHEYSGNGNVEDYLKHFRNSKAIFSMLGEIAKENRSLFADIKSGEDLIRKLEYILYGNKSPKGNSKLLLKDYIETLKLNKDFADDLVSEIEHYLKHGNVRTLGVNDAEDTSGLFDADIKAQKDSLGKKLNRPLLAPKILRPEKPENDDGGYWA